jgi:hypothetical protein
MNAGLRRILAARRKRSSCADDLLLLRRTVYSGRLVVMWRCPHRLCSSSSSGLDMLLPLSPTIMVLLRYAAVWSADDTVAALQCTPEAVRCRRVLVAFFHCLSCKAPCRCRGHRFLMHNAEQHLSTTCSTAVIRV